MGGSVSADNSAILLAAGQGTRIEGITAEPKVLLNLHGRSLIERHLEAWEAVGLQHAVLVVGYEQKLIREVVAALDTPLKITWVDNQEYAAKGNTHSMWLGLEASPAGAIVFDADLVYEPAILKRFVDSPEPNSILVGAGSLDDIECAKALVDEGGCVRKTIDKRAITETELQELCFAGEAIGVLKFDASTRAALTTFTETFLSDSANVMLNWEHLFNQFLPAHDIACHFEPSGQWVEIDTPEDYVLALEKFASGAEEA
jgi:choline kinase